VTTLTREIYAATYADPTATGEFGVDLIHQEVERDDTGSEVSREELSWEWCPAMRKLGLPAWSVLDADDLLRKLGYRRLERWGPEQDLGGLPGWTVPVEKVG
jgi:hypothetical protein